MFPDGLKINLKSEVTNDIKFKHKQHCKIVRSGQIALYLEHGPSRCFVYDLYKAMVNKIDACNTVLGYDCNVNNEQLKVWLFLKLYPSEVQDLIV